MQTYMLPQVVAKLRHVLRSGKEVIDANEVVEKKKESPDETNDIKLVEEERP